MTSVLASRAARRRGVAFLVLLVICVMLMAFSSNPLVREMQNGVGYAFYDFLRRFAVIDKFSLTTSLATA